MFYLNFQVGNNAKRCKYESSETAVNSLLNVCRIKDFINFELKSPCTSN